MAERVDMGLSASGNLPKLLMAAIEAAPLEYWWSFSEDHRLPVSEVTFTPYFMEITVPALPWYDQSLPRQVVITINGTDLAWFNLPIMSAKYWPWGGTFRWDFAYA